MYRQPLGVVRLLAAALLLTFVSVTPIHAQQLTLPAYSAGSDVVLYWNEVMLNGNATDHQFASPDQGGPTRTTRAFAITSASVFDTINSLTHTHSPYLTELRGFESSSREAAVSKAALDTLSAMYPQQAIRLQDAYNRVLVTVPNSAVRSQGTELGRRIAAAMLTNRSNDNSNTVVPYTYSSLPGRHKPDPLHPNQSAYAPNWGFVTPFVIGNVASYLPPPPPALNSFEYAAAYQQMIAFDADGVVSPVNRPAEYTQIGIFWGYDGAPGLGTPPRLYNQVVRVIAINKQNSVEGNARLFALVNLAMADAAIQCWYTKYVYDFWRPVIALRNGHTDGNLFTIRAAGWRPLGAPASNGAGDGRNFTPPFPSYTSGHSTMGTAAFIAAGRYFGTTGIPFQFTSDEYNGITRDANGRRRPVVTRSYSSLDQAILENANSRVYLGVHFSFDCTEGVKAGEKIANSVCDRALQPRK